MEIDRPPEIGNLRKIFAWGEKILKLPIAHALSVAGGSGEGLQTAGSMAQDVGDEQGGLGSE